MSAVCDRPEPALVVDLRVDCSVVLPQAIAHEAEAAAAVLVRLTPHRSGNPAWRAYHARFLERHGSGAVVPVRQVVDANTGLGYPAGYRGSLMKQPDPPAASPSTLRARPIRSTHHSGHVPGSSRRLYARLYGHPHRQTDILLTYLPGLLTTWEDGQPPDWWFLRYREPEPHLRLRIRLYDTRTYGAAAQRLGAWADHVRSLGLLRNIVLDTYYPEVGRYGAGAAMPAAEAVFAADSAVAIAQLTITANALDCSRAVRR